MDDIARHHYRQQMLQDPRYADPKRLLRFGAKAYSQFEDDGMIVEIFRRIGVGNQTFIEFGAGDGLENNTLALLVSGWRGLWLEGNEANVAAIRTRLAHYLEAGQLQVAQQRITRDNVDDLLKRLGPHPEPDLLSIDIDGNDFWVWEAITSVSPRVVVIEYNATWFPPLALTIPYREDYEWNGTNYFGASLKALEKLGSHKGYCLVGCDFGGVNAFFVRAGLVGQNFREPYTAENHYEPPRYWMAQPSGHPPAVGPLVRIEDGVGPQGSPGGRPNSGPGPR
jgi:hypothetical protein